ncbi:MAG: hypothetical protein QNK37_10210 [Acidobacteriota bacterium]|nr:hypothetical protein [Acidobacteriota bacterium]
MTERSFTELAAVHETLEACFLIHQETLVTGDAAGALSLFRDYRDLLLLHIHHEDDLLMPVFQRNGRMKRWPSELYVGEHDKFKGMLQNIEAGLERMVRADEVRPLDIVFQIDLEGGLKRLHEHHDQRERENFFPVLDQVTGEEERTALMDRCLGEWRETFRAGAFGEKVRM